MPNPCGDMMVEPANDGGTREPCAALGMHLVRGQAARERLYFGVERRLRGRRKACAVRYLDLESRELTELYRREGFNDESLEVYPDEEWILHAE